MTERRAKGGTPLGLSRVVPESPPELPPLDIDPQIEFEFPELKKAKKTKEG
jgi:hypothetical protein